MRKMKKGDSWKELTEESFPDERQITERTKENMKRNRSCVRNCVRLATGRVWTKEKLEEKRKKILNTPLP